MKTPKNIENDVKGMDITLTIHEFRIDPEGDIDHKKHVNLRGTMIFDFINKYIKENKFLSGKYFEILEVEKVKTPLGVDVPPSYDVSIYISGDDHIFIREIDVCDDDDFYDHYMMSEVFDYYVTQRFNNTDITSTVQLTSFSGSG